MGFFISAVRSSMNDQSEAPRLWAHKGETITCISGHPICDLARDIYTCEGRASADFTDWKQPEPARDLSVADIRCTDCKGVWIRGNARDGYQFHFSDGWR